MNLGFLFFKLLIYLFNKAIKIKALNKEDFILNEEEKTIKHLTKIYNLDDFFNLREIINDSFLNYSNLNTDLHSTLYSLIIELLKI